MRPAICLLVAVCFGTILWTGAIRGYEAPTYSAAGVANAASNLVGDFAPNTFVSIYGTGLCYSTRSMGPADIRGGLLPTILPGTGVRVLIGNLPALVYYVSPLQINVLIPSILVPGEVDLRVVRDGWAGPAVKITLADAAPALFQVDSQYVVANTPDWDVVTRETPARPGDLIVLWATGLGRTIPDAGYGELLQQAAPLMNLHEFQVRLNGVAVDSRRVYYAGIAPGFAGLYQINVRLPDELGWDPEVQVSIGEFVSPPGIRLAVRGQGTPAN